MLKKNSKTQVSTVGRSPGNNLKLGAKAGCITGRIAAVSGCLILALHIISVPLLADQSASYVGQAVTFSVSHTGNNITGVSDAGGYKMSGTEGAGGSSSIKDQEDDKAPHWKSLPVLSGDDRKTVGPESFSYLPNISIWDPDSSSDILTNINKDDHLSVFDDEPVYISEWRKGQGAFLDDARRKIAERDRLGWDERDIDSYSDVSRPDINYGTDNHFAGSIYSEIEEKGTQAFRITLEDEANGERTLITIYETGADKMGEDFPPPDELNADPGFTENDSRKAELEAMFQQALDEIETKFAAESQKVADLAAEAEKYKDLYNQLLEEMKQAALADKEASREFMDAARQATDDKVAELTQLMINAAEEAFAHNSDLAKEAALGHYENLTGAIMDIISGNSYIVGPGITVKSAREYMRFHVISSEEAEEIKKSYPNAKVIETSYGLVIKNENSFYNISDRIKKEGLKAADAARLKDRVGALQEYLKDHQDSPIGNLLDNLQGLDMDVVRSILGVEMPDEELIYTLLYRDGADALVPDVANDNGARDLEWLIMTSVINGANAYDQSYEEMMQMIANGQVSIYKDAEGKLHAVNDGEEVLSDWKSTSLINTRQIQAAFESSDAYQMEAALRGSEGLKQAAETAKNREYDSAVNYLSASDKDFKAGAYMDAYEEYMKTHPEFVAEKGGEDAARAWVYNAKGNEVEEVARFMLDEVGIRPEDSDTAVAGEEAAWRSIVLDLYVNGINRINDMKSQEIADCYVAVAPLEVEYVINHREEVRGKIPPDKDNSAILKVLDEADAYAKAHGEGQINLNDFTRETGLNGDDYFRLSNELYTNAVKLDGINGYGAETSSAMKKAAVELMKDGDPAGMADLVNKDAGDLQKMADIAKRLLENDFSMLQDYGYDEMKAALDNFYETGDSSVLGNATGYTGDVIDYMARELDMLMSDAGRDELNQAGYSVYVYDDATSADLAAGLGVDLTTANGIKLVLQANQAAGSEQGVSLICVPGNDANDIFHGTDAADGIPVLSDGAQTYLLGYSQDGWGKWKGSAPAADYAAGLFNNINTGTGHPEDIFSGIVDYLGSGSAAVVGEFLEARAESGNTSDRGAEVVADTHNFVRASMPDGTAPDPVYPDVSYVTGSDMTYAELIEGSDPWQYSTMDVFKEQTPKGLFETIKDAVSGIASVIVDPESDINKAVASAVTTAIDPGSSVNQALGSAIGSFIGPDSELNQDLSDFITNSFVTGSLIELIKSTDETGFLSEFIEIYGDEFLQWFITRPEIERQNTDVLSTINPASLLEGAKYPDIEHAPEDMNKALFEEWLDTDMGRYLLNAQSRLDEYRRRAEELMAQYRAEVASIDQEHAAAKSLLLSYYEQASQALISEGETGMDMLLDKFKEDVNRAEQEHQEHVRQMFDNLKQDIEGLYNNIKNHMDKLVEQFLDTSGKNKEAAEEAVKDRRDTYQEPETPAIKDPHPVGPINIPDNLGSENETTGSEELPWSDQENRGSGSGFVPERPWTDKNPETEESRFAQGISDQILNAREKWNEGIPGVKDPYSVNDVTGSPDPGRDSQAPTGDEGRTAASVKNRSSFVKVEHQRDIRKEGKDYQLTVPIAYGNGGYYTWRVAGGGYTMNTVPETMNFMNITFHNAGMFLVAVYGKFAQETVSTLSYKSSVSWHAVGADGNSTLLYQKSTDGLTDDSGRNYAYEYSYGEEWEECVGSWEHTVIDDDMGIFYPDDTFKEDNLRVE